MKITDDQLDASPDKSPLGLFANEDAQQRLFKQIKDYLEIRGATSQVALGFSGLHEQHSLYCSDGYWVVAYSEKGEQQFRAAFFSFIDATDFLLMKVLKRDIFADLDLSNIV